MDTRKVVINGIEDISIIHEKLDVSTLKDDECLIETDVSLISAGTELSRVFGLKEGATYPVYPGYCSVGKVIKVGSKVTEVTEGDRVLFSGPHSSHQKFNRLRSDGGILFKLKDETEAIDGAFLMMCSIAMNGILPLDVKLGDKVVVIGLGQLGLILSILYKEMGIDVIAVDPVKSRARIARDCGIDKVIDVVAKNQYDAIMDATDRYGADIVVDATGLSVCIETGFQVAARNGHVMLLGSPRTAYTTNITNSLNAIHTKMLNVMGGFNRRFPYEEVENSRISLTRNLKYLENLLNNKTIDTKHFISHSIKADEDELLKAYRGLMNNKESYLGVIIDWRK